MNPKVLALRKLADDLWALIDDLEGSARWEVRRPLARAVTMIHEGAAALGKLPPLPPEIDS